MDQIIIRSRNPARITLEEAEELAQAVRALVPDINVEVEGKEQKPSTYGVTYFQIIEIVLLSTATIVGKEMIQEFTKAGIEWARTRLKRKKGGTPIYIPIYGPDGEIVKSVVIKNATDEPEDRTEQDRELRKGFKKTDRSGFLG